MRMLDLNISSQLISRENVQNEGRPWLDDQKRLVTPRNNIININNTFTKYEFLWSNSKTKKIPTKQVLNLI